MKYLSVYLKRNGLDVKALCCCEAQCQGNSVGLILFSGCNLQNAYTVKVSGKQLGLRAVPRKFALYKYAVSLRMCKILKV